MYGLPETSDEVYHAFERISKGKADDKDRMFLDRHIADAKKSIREAKIRLDVEGFKTIAPPQPKSPLLQIMWDLNGGRR